MRVIIAGSRDGATAEDTYLAIHECPFHITEVVSGTARGVDSYGEDWALREGIPIKAFLPDWDRFGKYAGFRRNSEMAEYADALIAVWDGKSKGTRHMIQTMEALGKPVYVYKTSEQ